MQAVRATAGSGQGRSRTDRTTVGQIAAPNGRRRKAGVQMNRSKTMPPTPKIRGLENHVRRWPRATRTLRVGRSSRQPGEPAGGHRHCQCRRQRRPASTTAATFGHQPGWRHTRSQVNARPGRFSPVPLPAETRPYDHHISTAEQAGVCRKARTERRQ